MKIAALVMAHHRPDCLGRLLSRLQGELWSPYLHIDAKSDLAPFSHLLRLVSPVTRRIPVYWGTFSQVEATLLLLRQALDDRENTHFFTVTGQDYPIKADTEIGASIAEANHGGNYITIRRMPTPDKPLSRLEKRYYSYLNPRIRKKVADALPRRRVDRHLRGLQPFAGSAMWLFDRKAASGMLDFVDRNPWYSMAFRHTHCPDEMFFQTLARHLQLDIDGGCPTRSFWIQGRRNPELITPAILKEIGGDWQFMARKFDRYYPS